MPFDVEGAKKAGYSDAEIADYLAKQSDQTTKPAEPADYADVPGGGGAGGAQPQPGAVAASREAWRDVVDTSIQPGPNVGNIVPASVDPATGRVRLALPNPVRAIMTESPGGTTPGIVNDPVTGAPRLTEEMTAAASMPTALRFGTPRFVPPGTFDRTAELSPGFKRNPMTPDIVASPARPAGPSTPTGIPQQPEMRAVPSPGETPPQPGTQPGVAPTLTEAEMLARAHGYYSPADRAAAQGAMIPAGHTDSMLGVLTDAVPTDPHKVIATGNTPLIQLGKEYLPLKGQPMSYDAAITLDKRLTTERQLAIKGGNNTLASEIEAAQDKIREKMDTVPDDGTGDPKTLANVRQARQAYHQARKESQLNDIRYDASLLPEDKQNTYIRNRVTAMLRNDRKMSGWDADERAALEQALKSGNIGTMMNAGISMIKPFGRAAGGFGGSVLGVPGAIVGSEIGAEIGAAQAAKLRDALSRIRLDTVSNRLSQRVPPPPPGQ